MELRKGEKDSSRQTEQGDGQKHHQMDEGGEENGQTVADRKMGNRQKERRLTSILEGTRVAEWLQ